MADTRPDRADVRFGARTLVVAIGVLLAAVAFGFLVLGIEDRWSPLLRVDRGAAEGLHSIAIRSSALVRLLQVLSTVGSSLAYWIVFTPIVAWLLWRRRVRLAIFVAVTVLGGSLLNSLVKAVVHRTRPVLSHPVTHAVGLSFPSGHANGAVVAYSVLLTIFLPVLRRGFRALAIVAATVMVLGVGFARIGLGVHFVSDVVAGYILGGVWVLAMASLFRTWKREERQEDTDSSRHGDILTMTTPGAPEES